MNRPVTVVIRSTLNGLVERVRSSVEAEGLSDKVTVVEEVGPDCSTDAEILLGGPPQFGPILDNNYTNAKWFQSTYAGVDKMQAVKRRDFILTRAKGVFGQLMAEYTLGYILNIERYISHSANCQRQHRWEETAHYRTCRSLSTLTLGIIGYGSIGEVVGKSAKGLNMKVIGLTRRHRDDPDTTTSLSYLLANSDYILNLLPETSNTIGYLTHDILQQSCKKKPVFINCGRGTVISESDILQSLDEGVLSHAVLDVFPVEPLPESSPLWSHPSVTLTPHIAALTTVDDVTQLFITNLQRYLKGEELECVVDRDAGY
eukprot:TRINITY_DN16145_c0_g1_i1.p1 TRINITY_DN16145_c0_g1~~TRINITY_DN16145_c0_g1_i1.p1  ORF type:complete len:316 (+),score=56.80 TRINITY_DN16145_c0_g1_i1:310-1257(+)